MIFLSKYQDNQPAEPVKIKTSPFRNLDRTCNLIEEVFTREKSSRKKTYFCKTRGLRMGSSLLFHITLLYLKNDVVLF